MVLPASPGCHMSRDFVLTSDHSIYTFPGRAACAQRVNAVPSRDAMYLLDVTSTPQCHLHPLVLFKFKDLVA